MIIAASSLSWIAEPLPHARYSIRNLWDAIEKPKKAKENDKKNHKQNQTKTIGKP